MESSEYIPPTDEEIKKAQERLGFVFNNEYIEFIKSGCNMGESILEPLMINLPGSHIDIFEAVEAARKYYGLPLNLLPICEDNSDYYCLNEAGEIVFWSHNGTTDEMWPSLQDWWAQMNAEATS